MTWRRQWAWTWNIWVPEPMRRAHMLEKRRTDMPSRAPTPIATDPVPTSPFSKAGTATWETTQPTMKATAICMEVLTIAPATAMLNRLGSILIMSRMLRSPARRMPGSGPAWGRGDAATSVMGSPVVGVGAVLAVRQASGRLQSCLACTTVAKPLSERVGGGAGTGAEGARGRGLSARGGRRRRVRA